MPNISAYTDCLWLLGLRTPAMEQAIYAIVKHLGEIPWSPVLGKTAHSQSSIVDVWAFQVLSRGSGCVISGNSSLTRWKGFNLPNFLSAVLYCILFEVCSNLSKYLDENVFFFKALATDFYMQAFFLQILFLFNW